MAGGPAGDGFEPVQEEWMNPDLGSRAEIEQTLDTGLDNVFSEEPAEAAARTAQDAAPTAYTEWGVGASNDDSYNLEAFVAAEVTLGSHLAEQLAVAFAATATPTKVVWDMGDGSTVTCDGPGTPYDPNDPNAHLACTATCP